MWCCPVFSMPPWESAVCFDRGKREFEQLDCCRGRQVSVEKLKLVRGGAPAKPTAELDIALTHDLKKQSGTVSRADIHLGKDVGHSHGLVQFPAIHPRGEAETFGTRARGHRTGRVPARAGGGAFSVQALLLDQGTVALDAALKALWTTWWPQAESTWRTRGWRITTLLQK